MRRCAGITRSIDRMRELYGHRGRAQSPQDCVKVRGWGGPLEPVFKDLNWAGKMGFKQLLQACCREKQIQNAILFPGPGAREELGHRKNN